MTPDTSGVPCNLPHKQAGDSRFVDKRMEGVKRPRHKTDHGRTRSGLSSDQMLSCDYNIYHSLVSHVAECLTQSLIVVGKHVLTHRTHVYRRTIET